jgi:nicotinamide phosphoribosyltransferase
MNPFLATDAYKVGHHKMYPRGTVLVYSNFTPRSNKYAPNGCDKVVSFGQQMVMKQIKEMFDKDFFGWDKRFTGNTPSNQEIKNKVCGEIKKEYSLYLGTDYNVSHIEALWDLGYLPIGVKALPEGTLVPMGVPVLTICNTKPEFYWITNFLETLISNLLWKPLTSATIAHQYKQNLLSWMNKTDEGQEGFVEFQGHDFSMRGMDSIDATISSGLGHATSFLGSDSLPVIHGARKYYGETGAVIHGVNATEHSVMCAGSKDDEINTFRYLMDKFPTGILSIVSDTWDLWKVITEYLPILKDEILKRGEYKVVHANLSLRKNEILIPYLEKDDKIYYKTTTKDKEQDTLNNTHICQDEINWQIKSKFIEYTPGKIVIRPDSGDPVDIICGTIEGFNEGETSEDKGVIELLWDIFGGTTNNQGYKVLDPHIGAIYGDSITIDRAEEICARLQAKGFASTNIVLGVGSFTYQFNTRDTFGFAMKATYVEIKTGECEYGSNCPDGSDQLCELGYNCRVPKVEGREIFKDPITDDGTKKSAKGLLHVGDFGDKGYILSDQVDWNSESSGALQVIFEDGKFYNQVTLTQIREKLC